MARKTPPSFDYYPDDFAGGCLHLTTIQVGMYHKSIWFLWGNDTMPNDTKILCQIMGVTGAEFEEHWPLLSEKYETDDRGRLFNRRLKAEKDKKLRIIESRRESGKKGGRPPVKQMLKSRLSKTKAKKSKTEEGSIPIAPAMVTQANGGYSTDFETFWAKYPRGRRKSKGKAWLAWIVALKKASAEEIIERASEYAKSDEGNGPYVKMPSTWLNQDCWNDDPEAWTEKIEPIKGKPKEVPYEKRDDAFYFT